MRSHALHGYLTRDGIDPLNLLRFGREELARYDVQWKGGCVTSARCLEERGFEVTIDERETLTSAKLVLATGVRDVLPSIPGIEPLYGKSVHHCPYCDGWEWRDQPIAAYGHGRKGAGLALSLLTWSKDVYILSDGDPQLRPRDLRKLQRFNIGLRTEPITRVEGHDGKLERIVFESGEPLERRALFFNTEQKQSCDLAANLGCRIADGGGVEVDRRERTGVPGLFVIGDASRDVQFAIVAAAEGAKAAATINTEFQIEEGRKL